MTRLLRLAWRDVWRNRRRTLLTAGAVAFAVLITGLTNSLQYGTYDTMEEVAVSLFTGDLQVHRAGYHDEGTLSYSLEDAEQDWAECFDDYPWIEAAARRLTGYGLVSADSASAGALVLGIEPDAEAQITTFSTLVVEGERLGAAPGGGALLGQGLARNLGVGVGDTVAVLTQGFRGAMGADLYAVRGLLRTGSPDIDRSMMVLHLADAQFLLAMEGRFTEIVVGTRDLHDAEARAAALARDLPADRYEVMPWKQLLPELQQARALDDAGNLIFYAFLILLVGFEIFNTTTMSMMERVREFGVMLSIGMKPRQVSLLIGLELLMKVTLGLALGLAVTAAVVLALHDNPIPLSESMQEMYRDFGFSIEGINFSNRPVIYVTPLVAMAIVSVVAMVYPVLKMRTFSPVEALRTV